MPRLRRPHVASPDEVKITRDGDFAHIEYADSRVAPTSLQMGAVKLASMSDEDVLQFWNERIQALDEFIRTQTFTATEIPIGKPQLKYFEQGQQWTPRGHVVRGVVVNDSPGDFEDAFVSIDDRDFTVSEFVRLVGTFGGWGMRIEFVPDEEIHERPRLKVKEPEEPKPRARKRAKSRAG